jgi:hypothetical protein
MNRATRCIASAIVCVGVLWFGAAANAAGSTRTPGHVSYGVGYTLYNTPVWGRAGIVAYLSPYTVLRLTCWRAGAPLPLNGVASTLYYRLSGGGYVNAAWLYTGTDSVLPGERH